MAQGIKSAFRFWTLLCLCFARRPTSSPLLPSSNSHPRAYVMTRFLQATVLIAFVASAVTPVFGSPFVERGLEAREDVENIVYVTDSEKFW